MIDARSQRAYWLCQIGGWGLFGVLQAYAAIEALDAPWKRVVVEILLLHTAGLGLTHALRHYVRLHHWRTHRLAALTWRVLLAGLVLSIPLGIAANFMLIGNAHDLWSDSSYGVDGPLPTSLLRVTLQIVNWAAIFIIWLIIYFIAVRLRERRMADLRQSELARALQAAELRLLKSQLNPHFLFNALNTIRSLIAYDPTRARDAVTHLAGMLRYTLNSNQDELVSLAQELDIVNDYLALESMRFEERLRIDLDVAPTARGVRIPVMLLQTVVENAIKHGIAELPDGGVLRIRAALVGDVLNIEVSNPRPERLPDATQPGVGLKNAAERLRLLFGQRGSLTLDLGDANLAVVHIHIPALA
jgi:two-component system sensor histidine kinase AlgZ